MTANSQQFEQNGITGRDGLRTRGLFPAFWGFLVITVIVLALFSLFFPDIMVRNLAACGALVPFLAVSFILNRRGKTQSAVRLILYPLLFVLVWLSFLTGGLSSRMYTSLAILIFAAGMLLGKRDAIIFAALVIVSGTAMWIAEITGVLPHDPLTRDTAVMRWITQTLNVTLSAGLIYAAVRGTENLLDQRRAQNKRLEESNRRLQHEIGERKQMEAQLRRHQERYELAARAGRAGVWDWDVKTNDMYLDPILKQMLGYEDHEIKNHLDDWMRHAHPDDMERVGADIDAVLSGRQFRFETTHRMVHRDGSIRWVESNGAVLRDEHGEIDRIIGTDKDITGARQAEQALKQSEARLYAVLENMPVLMNAFDENDNIVVWNQECEYVTGYSAGEIVGNSKAFEIMYPDREYRQRMQQAWENGEDGGREQAWDITCKDGSVRSIVWADTSQRIAIPGWKDWNIGVDITEQKRAERELRLQIERNRQMLQTMIDGYILADTQGAVVDVNEAYCNMVGYAREELLSMNISELEAMLSEEEIAGRVTSLMEHGRAWFESKHRHKDGSIVEFEASFVTMEAAEDSLVAAFLRDITARKKAEAALQYSEQRFRALADQSPFSIIIYRPDGRPILSNKAHTKLWDSTPEETQFILANYNILEDPALEVNGMLSEIKKAFAGETPSLPPVRYDTQANQIGDQVVGGVRWLQAYIYPVKDEQGDVQEVVLMHEDITKRVEAEKAQERLTMQLQQLQRLESLGTLAGGIAHDFNNLLFAMLGNTELVRSRLPEGHPARPYLENTLSAGQRAKDLVEQILAFSRRAPSDRMPADLIQILDEAVRLITSTAPTAVNIETAVNMPAAAIMADASQIHQTIVNLCTNAIHAMPDGGTLTLTLEHVGIQKERKIRTGELPPGEYACLAVQDNGRGMDEATLALIFDPFFTTKEFGLGTGLGLSVVHGIIANHGGAIDVRSRPQAGARFDVYLPLLTTEPAQELHPEPATPKGWDQDILFVDDEPVLVTLAEDMLAELGYNPSVFLNPAAALKAFRENPDQFALVITDMMMSGQTGVELATEIKHIRPDIPVILMTGYGDHKVDEQAKRAGINTILLKPVTLDALGACIAQTLLEN